VVAEPESQAIAEGLLALRESDRAALARAARAAAEPFTYTEQAVGFESIYRRLTR
jgi:hypothetical protein